MLKIALLLIYSIGVTLLINTYLVISSNYEKILISGFILIPAILFGIFKIYEQTQEKVNFKLGRFFTYRIVFWLIVMVISGYIYPINSKMDLTNRFNNFTLLDDEYYYDDPSAEYDPGPYGGGGHDDSGYRSTIKIFFTNDDKIKGTLIDKEIIRKDKNGGFVIETDYEDQLYLNESKAFTGEYAYLNGYEYSGKENFKINQLKLPLCFLIEIFMKDGIYTLMSFLMLLIIYFRDESNLFEVKQSI